MKTLSVLLALLALVPSPALAWGYEGHQIIAALARPYLRPEVRRQIDEMLAKDTDPLTAHDMAGEATWADAYRGAGHRETAEWHFVDLELDHADLDKACFGWPAVGAEASQGAADDCVVDKINQFSAELADPKTNPAERLLALKYVLHFVGDVHQPLHASDNHDHGANCVQLSLDGPRTTNLHSYWDTGIIVATLGADPIQIARDLYGEIKDEDARAWAKGDAAKWAVESYEVAKSRVYTIGSKPGCDNVSGPLTLPAGYQESSKIVVKTQLEKAAVRLAMVLNSALRPR